MPRDTTASHATRKRSRSHTPPAAALNAMTSPATSATLGTVFSSLTGAVLIDLLLGQGKTMAEAATLTGIEISRLRADGLAFAMSFVRAIDPELGALMDASTPEDDAAEVARLAAQAPRSSTASQPGSMI